MAYKPVIGLEIHIELDTKTKVFCSCLNNPEEKNPNSNICPICFGHPGVLPTINEEAIKKVIKTGLALNCEVSKNSKFDRKNYFYPDLAKGYQISQNDKPLVFNGYLNILNEQGESKKVRIKRIHLEEDTGKLIHEKDCSLVDFNRSGLPLMELVTEPDISSAKEARKFAEELHLIMHYLNVSDADMEKGQMRVEVNVSLSKDSSVLGTRVEIKNLNSFRSVERAVNYEIERQTAILESGEKIVQETRGFDDKEAITFSQREKEEAHDYRYFPEPDLPFFELVQDDFIEKIKIEIPELPQSKRERLKKEYKLSDKEVENFVYDKELGYYFEKVISELEPNLSKEKLGSLIKLSANYLITDLKGLLKGKSVSDKDFLITPENFAEFIGLLEQGEISSKSAKIVLLEMFETGGDPSNIIEEKNLTQIVDEDEIEKIVKEAIKNNPKPVEDYKSGKEAALKFLVGQIMAKTQGKAGPETVTRLLKENLN